MDLKIETIVPETITEQNISEYIYKDLQKNKRNIEGWIKNSTIEMKSDNINIRYFEPNNSTKDLLIQEVGEDNIPKWDSINNALDKIKQYDNSNNTSILDSLGEFELYLMPQPYSVRGKVIEDYAYKGLRIGNKVLILPVEKGFKLGNVEHTVLHELGHLYALNTDENAEIKNSFATCYINTYLAIF